MAQREVIWTKTADIQFVGILEYWVDRNKSTTYSKKLLRMVAQYTMKIAENPFLYPLMEFNNLRVAILGNYSIYYKVLDEEIIIVAFWDNRQDPKNLLKILK